MNKKSRLKLVFYSLIVIFLLIVAFFFVPFPDLLRNRLFPVAGILGLIFLILGIVLAVMARKEKGRLKFFLMLTGISAVFPLLGSILHNVFYGLAIVFTKYDYVFEFLHGAFFILALLIAPIFFVIGVIASVFLLQKKN